MKIVSKLSPKERLILKYIEINGFWYISTFNRDYVEEFKAVESLMKKKLISEDAILSTITIGGTTKVYRKKI